MVESWRDPAVRRGWMLAACVAASLITWPGAQALGATAPPLESQGTIAAPQEAGTDGLADVAADGSILIAAEPATVQGRMDQGALFVFAKSPTGGWPQATQVATLTASDGAPQTFLGDFLGRTAIAGSTVAATASLASPSNASDVLDVFEQPAGGWSDTSHQSAELNPATTTGCQTLGGVSVLGDNVFVGCVQDLQQATGLAPSGSLLEFTRPSSGWSDAASQSATLVAPTGRMLGADVAPVNNAGDVFAASVSSSFDLGAPHAFRAFRSRLPAVYGFRQPAAGWSGQVGASTVLRLPADASVAALASSGNNVFVATLTVKQFQGEATPGVPVVYVFTKPRHGWARTVAASARLTAPFSQSRPAVTLSAVGTKVVLSDTDLSEVGFQSQSSQQLATFTEPVHGWYGTVAPTATAARGVFTSGAATSDGATIFATDDTNVDLFGVPDDRSAAHLTAPTATGSGSGLRAGQPRLRLRIATQAFQPAATSLTLALPSGLSFGPTRAARSGAVTVDGRHGAPTHVSRRQLTLALPDAKPVNTVVIGPGALRFSTSLRAAAQRAGRGHPLHRRWTVTIATEAGSRTTRKITAILH
ncbi:MAG TPA: hypothetical protein VGF68_16240 [Solirubrobacteraceae bacterium]